MRNGSNGVSVDGFNRVVSVTGTELATAYNNGHGMDFFDTYQSGTIQINDQNAFTANNDCGFSNRSNITAAADYDQWRGATTSRSDSAGVDLCTGTGYGPVSCPSIDPPKNNPPMLDMYMAGVSEPVYPMNAITKSQTVRVQGAEFNAIAGNPLASGRCSPGAATCRARTAAVKDQSQRVCRRRQHATERTDRRQHVRRHG